MLRVQLFASAIVMTASLYKPARADRIDNDSGGLVIEYALRVAKANERGRRIEFMAAVHQHVPCIFRCPKNDYAWARAHPLPFMRPMATVKKQCEGQGISPD